MIVGFGNPNSNKRSRDSSVGIATSYGQGDQGGRDFESRYGKIFTSPYRPGGLCGPPNLV
jgi:hypothetical protein